MAIKRAIEPTGPSRFQWRHKVFEQIRLGLIAAVAYILWVHLKFGLEPSAVFEGAYFLTFKGIHHGSDQHQFARRGLA